MFKDLSPGQGPWRYLSIVVVLASILVEPVSAQRVMAGAEAARIS